MMLAVDIVLVADDQVLLVERGSKPFMGDYALPGGFVADDETLDEAARRELAEETGVLCDDLRFLSLYDDPERDPRGRVVSAAYVGVLDEAADVAGGSDAAHAWWVSLDDAHGLAFDHDEILADALRLVR